MITLPVPGVAEQFMLRERLATARGALGTLLGVDADDVVFVPNVTHALNVAARSITLQPGDEVLTSDHEYGAIDRTWQYTLERSGARLVVQPLPLPFHDAAAIVDAFWQGVTPRTRVIALSHITSPTALILPVAEICRRARAAGILTVIDGAHAPGQIELDLAAIDADFYGGNCHKWLCAPKGAGFLYVRREHQDTIEPLVVSWGWRAIAPRESRLLDHVEFVGTNDPAAYLAVPDAIAFQQRHRWPAVRAACHQLAAQTRRRVSDLTGMPPICPDDAAWWGQMCVLPLPPTLEPALGQLWQQDRIEIPTIHWQGRLFVRLSVQAYTSPDDADRLVGALTRLLETTRRA